MIQDTAIKKLKKAGVHLDGLAYPKHIAFSASGHRIWAKANDSDMLAAYERMFSKIHEVIDMQVEYGIPVMTIYLLTNKVSASENFEQITQAISSFFNKLAEEEKVKEHKIKVSILGKWYDLPSKVIDPIKKVIDETRDYDHFFLNLCINYDGQEEIVDACKLITRKILAEGLDVDSINAESVKDNLYSSYFIPPDLMIKTGKERRLNGFLLWESVRSIIHFSDSLWIEFSEKDFLKAIKFFQDNRV